MAESRIPDQAAQPASSVVARRTWVSRWLGRPLLCASLLLGAASAVLLAASWRTGRSQGAGFARHWLQALAHRGQFDLRWIDLDDANLKDVLAIAANWGPDLDSHIRCQKTMRSTATPCWTLQDLGWRDLKRFELSNQTSHLWVQCDREYPLQYVPNSLRRMRGCGMDTEITYVANVRVATLRFPIWLPLAVFAGGPALFLAATLLRRRHRRKKGHCLVCAYDLTGNVSGVCPECGTSVTGRGGRGGPGDVP